MWFLTFIEGLGTPDCLIVDGAAPVIFEGLQIWIGLLTGSSSNVKEQMWVSTFIQFN